jgi:hypothetical protein
MGIAIFIAMVTGERLRFLRLAAAIAVLECQG